MQNRSTLLTSIMLGFLLVIMLCALTHAQQTDTSNLPVQTGTIFAGKEKIQNGTTTYSFAAQYFLIEAAGKKIWVGAAHHQKSYPNSTVQINGCVASFLGEAKGVDFDGLIIVNGQTQVKASADIAFYQICGDKKIPALQLLNTPLQDKKIHGFLWSNKPHNSDAFSFYSPVVLESEKELVIETESGSPLLMTDKQGNPVVAGMLIAKNNTQPNVPGKAWVISARMIWQGLYDAGIIQKKPDMTDLQKPQYEDPEETPEQRPQVVTAIRSSNHPLIAQMLSRYKHRSEVYMQLNMSAMQRAVNVTNYKPDAFYEGMFTGYDSVLAKMKPYPFEIFATKVETKDKSNELYQKKGKGMWKTERHPLMAVAVGGEVVSRVGFILDINKDDTPITVWSTPEPAHIGKQKAWRIPFTKKGVPLLSKGNGLDFIKRTHYADVIGYAYVSETGDLLRPWYHTVYVPKGSLYYHYAFEIWFSDREIGGGDIELVPIKTTEIYFGHQGFGTFKHSGIIQLEIIKHTLGVSDVKATTEDGQGAVFTEGKPKLKKQ